MNRHAFTLPELLLIVVIIVVLIGLLFPIYDGPTLVASSRTKANVMANDLNTAVINYYTEYGEYPFENTTGDARLPGGIDPTGWAELATTLFGNTNPKTFEEVANPTLNPLNIVFISFKIDQYDDNGVPLSPLRRNRETWSDEGEDYYFALVADTDYNGYVVPDNSGDGVGEGVAVWLPEHPEVKGSIPQLGTFKKQEP